ncbi:hypothetical protein C1646_810931 [Rhizophagus diaphanus]|nr:hypothetical protein C1646_810931 [Rhizophagus diaphanus] [Rhizophagus sp. MUCL 43196]
MSKNSLFNFTIFWIIFQVLIEVNCQMTPFKPSILSFSHTATLIDNKFYILDGYDLYGNQIVKNFFYLDVSVSFNTQKLLWRDLSNSNTIPPHYFATSVKGGANNNTLFLYGGFTSDQTMASVYRFNPQSIVWDIPKIVGNNTIRKYELTGIINYDGKFYLWSGTTNGDDFVNEMLILDTKNLIWRIGSLVNAPIPRTNYGATLLPNNKILYMGGINKKIMIDLKTLNISQGIALTLSEVYLYDTINDNWNTEKTSGKIPSNRAGFSTILGLDGQRIIIYGGAFDTSNSDTTALYVLDLTNYNWYIPKTTGDIPKPRVFHKANVIGKYMVISFGVGYNRTVESELLLLDISNNEEYIWTTNFDPSSSSHSLNKKTAVIVGCLQEQKTNENENYNKYSQEGINISIEKDNNHGQTLNNETITDNENNDYHGQEITQTLENENATTHEPTLIPAPVINEDNDYHGHEIMRPLKNTNVIDNEPTLITAPIIENNDYHGQEITTQTFENENATTHEPTLIPASIINENNDYHEREIMETPNNENTINHEPTIIPTSALVTSNYTNHHEQEVASTSNNDRLSLQNFKDEMLQILRQEITQNLKDEILQAFREEKYNNIDTTKNNTRQD